MPILQDYINENSFYKFILKDDINLIKDVNNISAIIIE